MHSTLEFIAVLAMAILSFFLKTLGMIHLSDVVGVITIGAGVSTMLLNYFRYKKIKKRERTPEKNN